MLEFAHFLHLASGVVWAGGTITSALAVEPALLRMKPEDVRGFLAAQERFAGAVMGISGMLLLVTGFLRAWLGGGLTGFSDLFATSYGLHVLAAFVLVIAVTVLAGRRRALTARLLAQEGDARGKLRESYRSFALLSTGGIMATIAIMAILGLGLY